MSTTLDAIEEIPDSEMGRLLAYAGLVLVAYELVKDMVVPPIKFFYSNMTFPPDFVFQSYEQDVLSRSKNEFEASLLYLRDFMEALDSADVMTIQALRKHRNEMAHELGARLPQLKIETYIPMFENVKDVIFKLSNYRFRMEMGSDPRVRALDIEDQLRIRGHEFLIFEQVTNKVRLLSEE